MKLKICGNKHQKNIAEIELLNPDYIGFIFYKNSSRNFSNSKIELAGNALKVGVFVNESFEEIIRLKSKYNLDLVQLHGDESSKFCEKLFNAKIKVIKSFNIDKKFNFNNLKIYNKFCKYFLFDTKGELYGGNGVVFDWRILENYNEQTFYFLSGGIGLENFKELSLFLKTNAAKKCIAIDVNSKFEIKPGIKDTVKLKEFKFLLNQLS